MQWATYHELEKEHTCTQCVFAMLIISFTRAPVPCVMFEGTIRALEVHCTVFDIVTGYTCTSLQGYKTKLFSTVTVWSGLNLKAIVYFEEKKETSC